MGVRPQHLRLGLANGADHVGFGGNLMVTEQLGEVGAGSVCGTAAVVTLCS